jgi:GH24 family phage-related lysozyme (muramidase)
LVIGHWSLVIGHWSLVIGHWSLVTGHWSLVTVGLGLAIWRCEGRSACTASRAWSVVDSDASRGFDAPHGTGFASAARNLGTTVHHTTFWPRAGSGVIHQLFTDALHKLFAASHLCRIFG